MASQLTTPRKKNVVGRKCTPNGSFLKKGIEHIDLKLSKNPTSSFKIPEIACHFLDSGKFDKLDLHCLSIDIQEQKSSFYINNRVPIFFFRDDEGRTM